jgi:hypothetical protein
MQWIGPALQTAAALVGAKAASDAAKASQKGTDLRKLRKEAEAAGFNPLTVLRATGGQGFNRGSTGALASASFWSSFANSAGQIAGQFDPLRKAQREANLAETRAQTAYLGSLTSANGKRIAGVQTNDLPQDFSKKAMSLSEINDAVNSAIGYYGDKVVAAQPVTTTEVKVMSDGGSFTGPAGDDADEQILNTLYEGIYMTKKGLTELSMNAFGMTPYGALQRIGSSKMWGSGQIKSVPIKPALQRQKPFEGVNLQYQ